MWARTKFKVNGLGFVSTSATFRHSFTYLLFQKDYFHSLDRKKSKPVADTRALKGNIEKVDNSFNLADLTTHGTWAVLQLCLESCNMIPKGDRDKDCARICKKGELAARGQFCKNLFTMWSERQSFATQAEVYTWFKRRRDKCTEAFGKARDS